MFDKPMKSDFFLQATIGCSWGVAVVALTGLNALGIGDRDNVLGVLSAVLAMGALAAIHALRKNELERGKLENALRENQQRYRQLIERFPGGLGVFEEGKAVYANLAGAQWLGAKSVNEIVGKDLLEFFDACESERISSIASSFKSPSARLVEQRLVRRDGTTIDVEIETTPVFRDGKQLVQILISEPVGAKTVEQTHEPERFHSACKHLMVVMQGGL